MELSRSSLVWTDSSSITRQSIRRFHTKQLAICHDIDIWSWSSNEWDENFEESETFGENSGFFYGWYVIIGTNIIGEKRLCLSLIVLTRNNRDRSGFCNLRIYVDNSQDAAADVLQRLTNHSSVRCRMIWDWPIGAQCWQDTPVVCSSPLASAGALLRCMLGIILSCVTTTRSRPFRLCHATQPLTYFLRNYFLIVNTPKIRVYLWPFRMSKGLSPVGCMCTYYVVLM